MRAFLSPMFALALALLLASCLTSEPKPELVTIFAGDAISGAVDDEMHHAEVSISFEPVFLQDPKEVTIKLEGGTGFKPKRSWWKEHGRRPAVLKLAGQTIGPGKSISLVPTSNLIGRVRSSNAMEPYSITVSVDGETYKQTGSFRGLSLQLETPRFGTYDAVLLDGLKPVKDHHLKVYSEKILVRGSKPLKPIDTDKSLVIPGSPITFNNGQPLGNHVTNQRGMARGTYRTSIPSVEHVGIICMDLQTCNMYGTLDVKTSFEQKVLAGLMLSDMSRHWYEDVSVGAKRIGRRRLAKPKLVVSKFLEALIEKDQKRAEALMLHLVETADFWIAERAIVHFMALHLDGDYFPTSFMRAETFDQQNGDFGVAPREHYAGVMRRIFK